MVILNFDYKLTFINVSNKNNHIAGFVFYYDKNGCGYDCELGSYSNNNVKYDKGFFDG